MVGGGIGRYCRVHHCGDCRYCRSVISVELVFTLDRRNEISFAIFMSFLPAILVTTEEELDQLLEAQVLMDQEDFCALTEQDHWAFHVDIILPEFARERGCSPTVEHEILLPRLVEYFEGQRIRLNIHIMGRAEESRDTVQWITENLVDDKIFGEIYVPAYAYDQVKQSEHYNWLLGVWYDKGEWEDGVEWKCAENLFMTVRAGYAHQTPEEDLKAKALDMASAFSEYYFVLDGGWKVDENPYEEHIEIAVNSDYWKTH